jgi:hypothetical protein
MSNPLDNQANPRVLDPNFAWLLGLTVRLTVAYYFSLLKARKLSRDLASPINSSGKVRGHGRDILYSARARLFLNPIYFMLLKSHFLSYQAYLQRSPTQK